MVDDASNMEALPEAAQAPAGFEASTTTDNTTMMPQTQPADTPKKDVIMSDAPMEQAAAQSPAPARTATPTQGSRAASVHPDTGLSIPSEAVPHGDPTRQYLNNKVTGVLLEGMKQLAKDQPSDPLRVLGEFLLQKSTELEKAA